ncbi:MAG: hypothetical protein ACRC5G_02725 [Cetobacterium sp.]
MRHCSSCSQTKEKPCSCNNKSHIKYEDKTSCCQTKPSCDICNKEETNCQSQLTNQFDFKEIFYKKNQSCGISNLTDLGIDVGDNLEYVIERLGNYISNFNYFDLRDNIYEATDFVSFMDELQSDINCIKLELLYISENQEKILLSINQIKEEINKLKNPEIIDTRGLGFTKKDTIFKVLQKISDNGL